MAGDGTTTATVLAQAIINEGFRNTAAGADPMAMKRGIEVAVGKVRQHVQEMARPVSGREEIAQVAALSAHDSEMDNLIADVMEKAGKDSVITVEEGRSLGYEVEYVEGMQIDRGYLSPHFITDSQRMEAAVENAWVLITDQKLSVAKDFLPALEQVLQHTKNVVVVAEDIEGEALATLVLNKMRGMINALAVKAPGFGERRKEMLQDMAILTGATLITQKPDGPWIRSPSGTLAGVAEWCPPRMTPLL